MLPSSASADWLFVIKAADAALIVVMDAIDFAKDLRSSETFSEANNNVVDGETCLVLAVLCFAGENAATPRKMLRSTVNCSTNDLILLL
jgi:hypothetical protein